MWSSEREDDSSDITCPDTGGSRVLAQMCDTCVFRPGNLLHLAPGRLAELIAAARASEGYIVCHSTLPAPRSEVPPAACRGFWDRYDTVATRLVEAFGRRVDVEPPHGH